MYVCMYICIYIYIYIYIMIRIMMMMIIIMIINYSIFLGGEVLERCNQGMHHGLRAPHSRTRSRPFLPFLGFRV